MPRPARLDYSIPAVQPASPSPIDFYRVDESSQPDVEQAEDSGRRTRFLESVVTRDFKKTRNPYVDTAEVVQSIKKTVKLTVLGLESEKSLLLHGNQILLNRANVDTGNLTISEKGHALLDLRGGEVFLSNQTHQKTTFIQVNGPVPIKSGDVILLGDRMLRVEFNDIL